MIPEDLCNIIFHYRSILAYIHIHGRFIRYDINEVRIMRSRPLSFSDLPLFPKLKKILAHGNSINEIRTLPMLDNLVEIDLGFNNLVDISVFPALPHLAKLCLAFNQIVDISRFPKMHKLRHLLLQGNQIKDCNLPILNSLTYLNLTGNKILYVSLFSIQPNLMDLRLDHNEIHDICSFPKLPRLHALSLIGNPMSSIHEFPILPKLRKLYVKPGLIIPEKITDKLRKLQIIFGPL